MLSMMNNKISVWAKFALSALILGMFAFSFASCSDPAGVGTEEQENMAIFTINLGGRSNRAAYPPTDSASISELRYVVKFSSGSTVKSFKAEGSSVIQGTIEIGTYDVTLEISLIADGSLFAEGEAAANPVTIVQGNNTVNVNAYKSVTLSPESAVVTIGQSQQFSASVHGDTGASVQWAVSGSNGSSSIDSTGKLTVGAESAGTILTVTASSGSNPVRRGTGSVEVTNKVNAIAPSLAGLPTTIQSYDVGTTAATLTARVTNNADITAQHSGITTGTGINALTYQWYSNKSNSDFGGTAISGATGLNFTPPTTSAGTAYYYMVATNTIMDNMDGGTKTVSTTSIVVMVDIVQPVAFSGVTANNTNGTTTSLTLNFSPAISGLTMGNISLTGPATATSLSGSGTSYTLDVTTSAAGTVSVSVTAPAGYRITGSPKTVNVVYPVAVTLNSVSASGSPFTTSLALNFSQAISGLTADDITLTPVTGAATKGTLSGSGTSYTLTVNTTAAGSISVAVAKVGYTISGSPKTVTVAYTSLPQYAITLSENGTYTFPLAQINYNGLSTRSVTITNAGYANTGQINIALSGANAGNFTLSKTSITDIAANTGSESFTVVPKTGLTVGTYTATVTVSGSNITSKSFNVSFEVTSSLPQYAITLSENGTYTFPSAVYGYGAQSARSVTVSNSGYANTSALSIALSGANAGDFTLSKNSITDIAYDGNDTFTVTPKTGLAVGTYTAAVTVSGTNVTSKSFNVSFEVTSISVTFSGVTANNTSGTTTSLTLTFSQAISGLSASNITLTNGTGTVAMGTLSGSGPSYTLAVTTTVAGTISVAVSPPSGYNVSGSPKNVTVSYAAPVTFDSVTANGNATMTTTQLTLIFSQAITGLSASNITLTSGTGATRGSLTDNGGGSYTLAITGITSGGSVSVTVTAPSGYTISGTDTRSVSVSYYPSPLTITISSAPAKDLSPIDTSTTFGVQVSGFITGSDANNVGLIIDNVDGLNFSNYNTTGNAVSGTKTFTVTVSYNSTTEIQNPAKTITIKGLTVSGSTGVPSGYAAYNGPDKTTPINVFDGQADYPGSEFDRRIPVNNSNISQFKTYANTTNGLSRHYKQVGNITLTGTNNWSKIGGDITPFIGSYDGQGNTISGLDINNTSPHLGFFGYVGTASTPGTVKNLGLISANITGTNNAGGVVGSLRNGTVEACYFTGSINGDIGIGGVVGSNSGSVTSCYFNGNISATGQTVGGVVGINSGTVQKCHSSGTITCTRQSGGVVGTNQGTLEDSYSNASVTASSGDNAGGVIGYSQSGSVQNCYSTGPVIGNGTGVGGIAGNHYASLSSCVALNPSVKFATGTTSDVGRVIGSSSGSISGAYARDDMSVTPSVTPNNNPSNKNGQSISSGTANTQYNSQYFWQTTLGWDFSSVWQMSGGANSLPILRGVGGQ